jgi:hypothetical protein
MTRSFVCVWRTQVTKWNQFMSIVKLDFLFEREKPGSKFKTWDPAETHRDTQSEWVCVCVWEREREREKGRAADTYL